MCMHVSSLNTLYNQTCLYYTYIYPAVLQVLGEVDKTNCHTHPVSFTLLNYSYMYVVIFVIMLFELINYTELIDFTLEKNTQFLWTNESNRKCMALDMYLHLCIYMYTVDD